MTRDIILLVLTLSGEPQETRFDTEWPCVQAARKRQERGEQAWCVIQMPDDIRAKMEKYPKVPWSKEMNDMLKAMQ